MYEDATQVGTRPTSELRSGNGKKLWRMLMTNNWREHELFTIKQVTEYDENWKKTGGYKYAHFCSNIIDLSNEELNTFIERTIKSLRDRQEFITKVRSIPLETIKDDLDPKIYKLIEHQGITNLYELRRNVHRRWDGTVTSRIVGIAKVKGTEILNVLEKYGIPIDNSMYGDKWE